MRSFTSTPPHSFFAWWFGTFLSHSSDITLYSLWPRCAIYVRETMHILMTWQYIKMKSVHLWSHIYALRKKNSCVSRVALTVSSYYWSRQVHYIREQVRLRCQNTTEKQRNVKQNNNEVSQDRQLHSYATNFQAYHLKTGNETWMKYCISAPCIVLPILDAF